jgi:hypothetical protein
MRSERIPINSGNCALSRSIFKDEAAHAAPRWHSPDYRFAHCGTGQSYRHIPQLAIALSNGPAKAAVHDRSSQNGDPVRQNVPHRKEAAQQRDPRHRQPAGIQARRVIQLQELNRRSNSAGKQSNSPDTPKRKKRRDDPVNHQRPHRRSTVLHHERRQSHMPKANRQPSHNSGSHQHKRNQE